MLFARQGLAKTFGLLSLLLSQSCILLYQSDGGAGGGGTSAGAGTPGGGGTGGAAAGGSAAGGAEVGGGGAGGGPAGGGGAGGGPAGGGGAGGDCSNGGPTGDWLVDVGTFTNGGGEPGRLQSMVETANGTILIGGFSGAGFTPVNSVEIAANTFFLLEVGVNGEPGVYLPLGFNGSTATNSEPSISLARRGDDIFIALSTLKQLEVKRYDEELTPLLTCSSDLDLKLGSLASNGDQLLLAMQVSGVVNCTKPQNVTCPAITAGLPSTLLWPVEDSNDFNCAKHRVVGPVGSEFYFSAPRIALGPSNNGSAELLVTANGGPNGGPFTHRLATGTLTPNDIDDGFEHSVLGNHTSDGGLAVIPAAFQSGLGSGIVGGARGGAFFSHQFFVNRASTGTPNDGVQVDDTSSRLEALHANENTLLAVGAFDQKAINELAGPDVTCGIGCNGWLAFDQGLNVVGHQLALGPMVRAHSGIVVGQAVYSTGDSSEDLEFGCDSLPVDDDQRHAFVARNALPMP